MIPIDVLRDEKEAARTYQLLEEMGQLDELGEADSDGDDGQK